MALFKSGNPALNKKTFAEVGTINVGENEMTLEGTVHKASFLLLLVIASALYTWNTFLITRDFSSVGQLVAFGCIGGFVVGLITVFNKPFSPYLSPVYAVLQGLSLGGLSAAMDDRYPGIVIQALFLTFGIFAVLLIIYKLKIIEASENFKLIVTSATAGLALYYLASFGLSFAGVDLPFIHENDMGGIIFSLFAVVLASLNLVVDFDFIEQGAKSKAPKYMEWYGAFGLMVTIIWLYLEILRLLAKSRSRK
jgi:uncharacterized YccA/Bax inhibitor family protein